MTLRILLDENVPPQVGHFIQFHRPDWAVRHVGDVGLRGATDEQIFRWAQVDNSLVITFDEDFADARMYPAGCHSASGVANNG